MADVIGYDYQSMQQAYQDIIRISNNIAQSCEEMTAKAVALLASAGGEYATAYQEKEKLLDKEVEDFNDILTTRTKRLQELFDEMAELDRSISKGV